MTFFRGRDKESLMREFHGIVDAKNCKTQGERSLLSVVSSGAFLRPFTCVGVILILFRLSGFPILSHYTAPYLKQTGMKLDNLLVSLIIGILRLAFSLAAFLILPLTTKRFAFIACGSIGTLGMLMSKLPMYRTPLIGGP